MGAWGTDAFSNDDALDFLADLVDADDDTPLYDALANVAEAEADENVEAGSAFVALAAAEVVAALAGQASPVAPEALLEWVDMQSKNELVDSHLDYASQVVERVKMDSELAELWSETEHAPSWAEEMADLRRRLALSKTQK